MNLPFLKEFIDRYGVKISGDEPINQSNNMTASDLTNDDKVVTSRQGISRYFNYGRIMVGEDDEENVELSPQDKKKIKPNLKSKKRKPHSLKSELKETSKNKMDELIEDVFTKKDFDKDFITKKNISDLRLNAIQPIDTIKESNPILLRKVVILKDLMDKDDITGEEKAIILNHLLSIDMTDIPQQYKEELKKKII